MRNLKKQFRLILVFPMIFLGISCDDENNNPEPEIIISVFPDIGTTETEFEFTVEYLITEGDTTKDLSTYHVRWDLDNDDIWDTDWLDTSSISALYNTNGKHIIKTELQDQNGIIYNTTHRAFVQELIQITDNTSTSSQMNSDWCPDGSNRIAFEWRPASGEHRIFIVQYPNETPEPVTTEPAHFAEWSPDGQFLLFERSHGQWIVNLETGAEEELMTQEYHVVSEPRWSPDGSKIVFTGVCDELESICLFDVNDTSAASLILSSNYHTFCWSPDGNLIAAGDETKLDIYDINSGDKILSFSSLDIGRKIDWSPDGNFISLGFSEGILNVININNGRILTIKPDSIDSPWYPGWSSDGLLIAFEGKHESESYLSIWAITFPDDI